MLNWVAAKSSGDKSVTHRHQQKRPSKMMGFFFGYTPPLERF
jgi:hypothetical protein